MVGEDAPKIDDLIDEMDEGATPDSNQGELPVDSDVDPQNEPQCNADADCDDGDTCTTDTCMDLTTGL